MYNQQSLEHECFHTISLPIYHITTYIHVYRHILDLSCHLQHWHCSLAPAVLCHVPQEDVPFTAVLGVHHLAAGYPDGVHTVGPHIGCDHTRTEH